MSGPPTIGRVTALWDFPGGAPTDLPLKAGQTVNLTRKIDANWWEGEFDGRIGIFPVQYVKEEFGGLALPADAPAAGSKSSAPTSPATQPATVDPVCASCGLAVSGDILRWQGKPYHTKQCLKCTKCGTALGSDAVIKKVGSDPHCKDCFNSLMFGPAKPAAAAGPRPLPMPASAPSASAPAPAASAPTAQPQSPTLPPRSPRNSALPTAPSPASDPAAPPPLPSRAGSNIHRPAPPVPGTAVSAPPTPPLQPHRPAPLPPGPDAAASAPPVPVHTRPAYDPNAAAPAVPYASRPQYTPSPVPQVPPPVPTPSPVPPPGRYVPPPPSGPMAAPTGVIAHPNNPSQHPSSTLYPPAPVPGTSPPAVMMPGQAYIPPPPPPIVPVVIPPSNPYSTHKKVKALFIGDPAVGKTAMLHAAITGVFYQAYVPTPNAGLFNAMVFTDMGKTAVDLELYDMSGNFYADPNYRHGLYGIADVYVLCFDQLNRTTFENIENLWWADMRDHFFTLKPIIVVATKKDLVQSGTRYAANFVRHQECLDFAQRLDAEKFFDTSAQKNIGLHELLEKIAKVGTSPISQVHSNKRVDRVVTERKKEGKRGVFGSLADHVRYGMK